MMVNHSEFRTDTRVIRKGTGSSLRELKADTCIVGAGIAGVSAALEAARLGHHVALVDSLPALGGQAVNSIIGAFCGLFANGRDGYQLTHGIADDILRDLGTAGALHYRKNGFWTTVVYDEVALSRWIENAVYSAGITLILGAVLRGVSNEDRRIRYIDLATRYGDVRLTANAFVDATGDAALAWHAGLPCREPEKGTVYGSHMVVVEGINEEKYPEREEISRRLKERAGDYGLIRRDGFAFAFPGRGTALVNMTHVETPLEPVAAAAKAIEGKAQADKTVQFLKREFPEAFGNARVRSYGLPGIRQTRWIVGRQQLTIDDVRTGRRFPDAIARTGWALELHDRLEGYAWEAFSEDHVHYVPMGSLTPPDVDNLVAVGRCIDGDLAALSSVRVMGPCIAMGAAAAHALDLAGTGSVHQIDNAALQERVKDNVIRTD
ncbi:MULTISPECIES: FAD-dependent oxidoreductase [Paenibacillus]|uniref:FAD-dependent oxidoreductase n=1 Tax=Paenibacillus TaxID=44249 RepID=UPI0010B996E4|nr:MULTISPECIES: FAD-dependent oxidoreductase [Paenibacillus]GCL71655.1 FAD-dependent oxidoreductase [Paenibacillus naphthalenovorans]